MIFDTDFLIVLSKGRKDYPKNRAEDYLAALPPAEPLLISRVTWMEYAAGCETLLKAEQELARFTVIEFDGDLWFAASRIIRTLAKAGQKIAATDCMIAATAIAYGQTVVTLNHSHFSRVTGLRVATP